MEPCDNFYLVKRKSMHLMIFHYCLTYRTVIVGKPVTFALQM